ncbi:MAG: T9SS type A sorting domain-containing protein [Ignavibacteriales bacterium]|nr:T9SS type A sorting domain-containing protein [Ignavibacteriales bacterium]
MMSGKNGKLLTAFTTLILLTPTDMRAQTKNLWIGELWHTEENDGSGGWEQSYAWPGNHWREKLQGEVRLMNGSARAVSLCYGMKNWKEYTGTTYPYVVGAANPSTMVHPAGSKSAVIPLKFKLVLRRKPPTTIVDGIVQAPRQSYDEIDPSLVSDAKLMIRYSFETGITIEQTLYAYACGNADSYFYYDFVALNNGNAFGDESVLEYRNQHLYDVCFAYGIRPCVSFEGSTQNSAIWEDNNDDWVEYYGENYRDFIGSGTPLRPAGNPLADSLRVFITWDGDNNRHAGIDDTGDPDENSGFVEQTPGQGQFLSPQYFGMGILHADKSVNDITNDLTQPYSTVWRPGNVRFTSQQQAYEFYFTGKHLASPQEMGFTEPNDPLNVAAPNSFNVIGPYDMPYMSKVHWVMLVGVNGLTVSECIRYGRLWWQWRNGGTGITDKEKNEIIAKAGRERLFKVFGTATRRYFANIEAARNPFDAPDPPPAPDLKVTAGERSVLLEWSDVSQELDPDTKVKDFAGYRVYRATGRNDTGFVKIWECGGKSGIPATTSYRDSTVQRGFAYFYYVTAYDDGTQNWEEPGVSLESGKYWNMMQRTQPVHPYLTKVPVPTLANIKVVPNPYHDLSVQYNYPGEPNKIMFINIPPVCTIKIYTMTGDLVKTLHHTDGTSEEPWNQVTEYNQLVYSGVYLYVVQSDMGNKVGKFVIVRTSTEERPPQ